MSYYAKDVQTKFKKFLGKKFIPLKYLKSLRSRNKRWYNMLTTKSQFAKATRQDIEGEAKDLQTSEEGKEISPNAYKSPYGIAKKIGKELYDEKHGREKAKKETAREARELKRIEKHKALTARLRKSLGKDDATHNPLDAQRQRIANIVAARRSTAKERSGAEEANIISRIHGKGIETHAPGAPSPGTPPPSTAPPKMDLAA